MGDCMSSNEGHNRSTNPYQGNLGYQNPYASQPRPPFVVPNQPMQPVAQHHSLSSLSAQQLLQFLQGQPQPNLDKQRADILNTCKYVQVPKFEAKTPVLIKEYSTVVPLPNTGPIPGLQLIGQTVEIKTPKDIKKRTEFYWVKQQKFAYPAQILKIPRVTIRSLSFQQKHHYLRYTLEAMRLSWTSFKSEYLEVDRSNLLMSSMASFSKINFYREVKIVWKDEKEVNDAGGVMREWMSMCVGEVFGPELGMMRRCSGSDGSYAFQFNQACQDLFTEAAYVLGVVVGKAIFQKMPLKCFLNQTILRQLSNQPVHLADLSSLDPSLHSSFTWMLNNAGTSAMEQHFCLYRIDQTGKQEKILLKQNGDQINVTSDNRRQYIELMIDYQARRKIEKVLNRFRNGVYSIIPMYLFQMFEPWQLDMIICGRSEIDVDDWQKNTIYQGYTATSNVIKWFWDYLKKAPQQNLQNLLHFTTGSSRLPLTGFKYLESNRGQLQKFTIKKIPFDKQRPYPIGHTCFNRLQLPEYPNQTQFQEKITLIAQNQITTFGLQ